MKKAVASPAKSAAKTRITTAAPAPPATVPASAPPTTGQAEQAKIFDKAAALFHRGDFASAGKLFEKAADGPVGEMACSARLHARMCERRTSRAEPALASAEDHYNYAVALLNRRELQGAEKHLHEGLKLAPNADHIHYALALASGLRGEARQAFDSLKRAIELNPRNRAQARNDPDFVEFAHQPLMASLLFPERAQRS
ncbi:MAG: hypothetical protein EHM65_02485 [Acidobacteriales bacterium]|nr:MAG: hypothetical protein EHM65_02485 [Terriglobales bacterium]